MRIEVLYVPGCRNFQPALERIAKVLASEALRADIEGVPVNSTADANALQFPGSPTIRINGNDVEPDKPKAPAALACRLYENGGGIPSEELLRMALARANQGEGL